MSVAKHRYTGNHYLPRDDSGVVAHRRTYDEAQLASRELKERLETAFQRFSHRHGVSADEARILLLDTGVRL